MPRFNPYTGEALCGVSGLQPSVDGVYHGPVGSTAPTVWLNTDTILHQVSGVLSKTDIRTSVTTPIGGAVNELSAGCNNRYLAYNSAAGLFGAIILPDGGLNRVITDARGANSNDGCLVYIKVRSTTSPTIVKHPTSGKEVQLPDMYGLHLLKWGQAVWNSPTAGVLDFWGKSCAYIPGASNAKLAKLGNDLWITYLLAGVGLVAHKAISPTVYHLITSGVSFHHDAIVYAGKLAVCYNTNAGEDAGSLVKVMDVVATSPTTAVPSNIVPGGATVGPTIPPEDVKVDVKQEVFPQFADLKGILSQSKQTDNALYQTVQEIIERLSHFRGSVLDTFGNANDELSSQKNDGTKALIPTYLTKENETLILPNSIQVVAGDGITFDDTVPNKRTIKSESVGIHPFLLMGA